MDVKREAPLDVLTSGRLHNEMTVGDEPGGIIDTLAVLDISDKILSIV